MKKKEAAKLAQDLIMQHLSGICYGDDFKEFKEKVGDEGLAYLILQRQMNRVAKIMGFVGAWFS